MRRDHRPSSRRPPAWGWLVAVSVCLVLGAAVALGVGWAASEERRTTLYEVRGSVTRIVLDLGAGTATIVGGGDRAGVAVRHTDRFSFGHSAVVQRVASDGVLSIRSRCPSSVVGGCSTSYRVTVPDNVAVTVRTTSGHVRLVGVRGGAQITTTRGDIDVERYCGFSLEARADSGDIRTAASCAPPLLDLRSRSGDVSARVPVGRYRVEASTNAGDARVRDVTDADDAPFAIRAASATGAVDVAGSR